jgi:hypothetical protein
MTNCVFYHSNKNEVYNVLHNVINLTFFFIIISKNNDELHNIIT